MGRIHNIVIGPHGADGSSYPAIYLMHQPLNRTATNSDISQIRVDSNLQDWSDCKELTLPVNVQKVLDIAPAFAGFLGHGLVYLCEQNGERSLYAVFVRPGEELGDRGTATQFQFPCPDDATSIETFTDYTDDENRSSLLIGCGAGLRLMVAKELTAYSGISTIMINSDECLSGVRDLHVTQTEDQLSVFAINNLDELVFVTTKVADLRSARAAPIIPSGVSAFSAMIGTVGGANVHALICNDSTGNLTYLSQALDTGIWRQEPFFVEASGEMLPFESYTVTISAKDTKANPFVHGKVQVFAASTLPAFVNGRSLLLTPMGSWLNLDSAGELGLIIPTTGITSQPLSIRGLRDVSNKQLELQEVKIDCAWKVLFRMSSLDSEEALLGAKDANGKSIWGDAPKPCGDDLKNAVKCFAAIEDAHRTVPKDGSIVKTSPAVEPKPVEEIGNPFMDAFHWLKQKFDEVSSWFVRKLGDVWEFVCEIAGKAVNFVLDCVEKVTEAASWVWDKLKVGWDKLCKFVGFLFSWDDILETKDTIVSFLNAGLDMAANRVEGVNAKVDALFSDVQQIVTAATGATSRPAFKMKTKGENKTQDKEMDGVKDSAPSKWVGERMKNGNARQRKPPSPTQGLSSDKDSAEAVQIWNDRIEPVLKDFGKLVDDLAKDISELFKENKGASPEALVAKMGGNLLVNLLEIVKKMIQAVISVVAKVVLIVKAFGNLEFRGGGFLPSFYRFIAKGKPLTIFEAVSLLIAIPSTLIIKLVTGHKPPPTVELDASFLESAVAAKMGAEPSAGKQVASKQHVRDVDTLVLGCGCGAALDYVLYKTVKLAYKTATGGVSLGVTDISPSAVTEMFGMAIDAFSLFKDILVDPPSVDTPGKGLMDIATAIKCFRLAANALYMLATKLGYENPAAEGIMLCVDMLSGLVNLFLYSAVYAIQLDATSWPEHDEDAIVTAVFDNFMETLAHWILRGFNHERQGAASCAGRANLFPSRCLGSSGHEGCELQTGMEQGMTERTALEA